MLKALIGTVSVAILFATATPAAAAIETIDFVGVGRVSNAFVTCWRDADDNETCPTLADYRVPAVGTRVDVTGRYTVEDFQVAESGFSTAEVYEGTFRFSVVPNGPPGGLLAFHSDVLRGRIEFNNAIVRNIDLILGDERCGSEGDLAYDGATPSSGSFGFFQCGWLDDITEAPYYGYEVDWRIVRQSINGGAFTSVPEPQSWALMIGGFGLVGAALRRRERLATV